MAELVAVQLECWRALKIPESTIRHYARSAHRRKDDVLVFHAGHAFVKANPAIFTDCAGPVPTEAAVAAVERLVPMPPEPVPYADWPAWAKATAALRKPEDTGVGDTIKRLLSVAGTAYEATMKAMGLPCKCPARRRAWNVQYRYE